MAFLNDVNLSIIPFYAYAHFKSPNQPVQHCSLIRTIAAHCLDSIIPLVSTH